MKITEPNDRPRELIDQLVGVWERSVRVSHGFLSGADVERIKGYAPQAILGVEHLVVAYDAARPLAFLGANGPMLEMLFVDVGLRGHGIGSALLRHGIGAGEDRLPPPHEPRHAHAPERHSRPAQDQLRPP